MREPGRKQRKTKGEREGNKRKGSHCHDRISHLSQHREPRAMHSGKLLNQNALIFAGEKKALEDKKSLEKQSWLRIREEIVGYLFIIIGSRIERTPFYTTV